VPGARCPALALGDAVVLGLGLAVAGFIAGAALGQLAETAAMRVTRIERLTTSSRDRIAVIGRRWAWLGPDRRQPSEGWSS
jgi:hypothetical protein